MTNSQAPQPAPRPFTAVKAFADSVLAMLDERIKAIDQAAHPFNDYFGDQPETIVAAKAQAGELREVRAQVRILGDRALVDLMKFKPAIPAPEGAQVAALRTALERLAAVVLNAERDGFANEKTVELMLEKATPESPLGQMRDAIAALAAPAPQAPVPMTDAEIGDLYARWKDCDGASFADLMRAVERHHGITQTKEPTNDR